MFTGEAAELAASHRQSGAKRMLLTAGERRLEAGLAPSGMSEAPVAGCGAARRVWSR